MGEVVTDKLIEHFPDVVDVNFTAYMEKELDDIAEGRLGKIQMLHEFNGPFERALEKAEHSFERYEEDLDEDVPALPDRGARARAKLQVKLGRFGKFIGCTNYPDCRYIRNMDGIGPPGARDARRDSAPSAAGSCRSASADSARSSGAAATPTARSSRRTPPDAPA